ncbi:hypothetical protein GW17_00043452 [Ensete ventricosum]|nr:hypothetical protein GW17_00043452 [Ensete ventricosum]
MARPSDLYLGQPLLTPKCVPGQADPSIQSHLAASSLVPATKAKSATPRSSSRSSPSSPHWRSNSPTPGTEYPPHHPLLHVPPHPPLYHLRQLVPGHHHPARLAERPPRLAVPQPHIRPPVPSAAARAVFWFRLWHLRPCGAVVEHRPPPPALTASCAPATSSPYASPPPPAPVPTRPAQARAGGVAGPQFRPRPHPGPRRELPFGLQVAARTGAGPR